MKSALHTRLSWRWKALIPLVALTLLGMALLVLYVPSAVLKQHLLMVSGVVVTVLLVMSLVLVVLVDRPLGELRRIIARASEGDRSVRVAFAERADEIGELGSDFNRMVHHLQENCARCERLHRAEMREAEHLATLGEIAAGLAHEIKNPLAGISGAIEILADEFLPGNPNREVLQQVRAECRRIQKLTNDLLSYAKPKDPSLTWADLNDTVESAGQFGRQMLHRKSLQMDISFDPALPPVRHDPQLIREVVVNLLLNSVQACQPGGLIQIKTSYGESSGSVEILVRDNGRGIPQELLPRIFQPFFTTKGPEGTGLGLSLTRRIVEQHGGGITVSSVPGKATEFKVRLPAGVPELVARQ
ncbi:MAG: HAMP domain-containing protein [Acidobacteria bacterium]|nr:HAMP domain-containing protein [Acidobacteriota bacterium]